MIRSGLCALLLFACAPHPAWSAELGRLFFTPSQRSTLDNARRQNIRVEIANDGEAQPAPAAPVPQNVSVNGMIRRSDGKNTIWLNNRAITEQHPGAIGAIAGKSDGRVVLSVPDSGRKLDLKVGQSVEIVSGTIEDNYLRRRPVKSDAKGPADAEKAQSDVQKVTSGAPRDAVKSEPALQRRSTRNDNDGRDDNRTDEPPGRR